MHGTSVLPPIGTIYGVALNDRRLLGGRLDEFNQPPYQKPPQKPVLFIKTPNTLNRDGGQVAQPRGERLQPGPTLAVVIGRDASRVKAADALAHIAGYMIGNEFSLPEDSYYRPAVKAKCRDGFCALGNTAVLKMSELSPLTANELGRLALEAGQIILGGSFTRPVAARPGDTFHVDYDQLGSIACRFV